ncbi:MAG: hypothetical protein R3C60_06860 [Parvularculaceae bacterium]
MGLKLWLSRTIKRAIRIDIMDDSYLTTTTGESINEPLNTNRIAAKMEWRIEGREKCKLQRTHLSPSHAF